MELPSLWYFLFWAIVNQAALTSVCLSSDKLKSDYAFYVEFVLSTSTCFSSTYAFLLRPSLERVSPNQQAAPAANSRFRAARLGYWLYILSMVTFSAFIFFIIELPVADASYSVKGRRFSQVLKIYVTIAYSVSGSSAVLFVSFYLVRRRYKKAKRIMAAAGPGGGGDFLTGFAGPLKLYSSHTLCWALVTASYFAAALTVIHPELGFVDKMVLYLFPFGLSQVIAAFLLMVYRRNHDDAAIFRYRKVVQYPLGVLGNILGNHFLDQKSLPLLWMLISLEICWLGNLAMRHPSREIGVFGFLIGAILDCARGVFGLGKYTGLVGVCCVVLLFLHGMLDAVKLQHPEVREADWDHWQRIEGPLEDWVA